MGEDFTCTNLLLSSPFLYIFPFVQLTILTQWNLTRIILIKPCETRNDVDEEKIHLLHLSFIFLFFPLNRHVHSVCFPRSVKAYFKKNIWWVIPPQNRRQIDRGKIWLHNLLFDHRFFFLLKMFVHSVYFPDYERLLKQTIDNATWQGK